MRHSLIPFLLALTALAALMTGCSRKESLLFDNATDPQAQSFVGYEVLSPDELVNLPVLALQETPELLLLNIPYTFSAIASDPNPALLPENQPGSVDSIKWEFGDGTVVERRVTEDDDMVETHTYTAQDNYMLIVSVWDNDGNCRTLKAIITVFNQPPRVEPGGPYDVRVGFALVFEGSAHDNGEVVAYEWDLDGDGTVDWSSDETAVTSWTYNETGTYFATLRAQDNSGVWAQAATSVKVVPTSPTCDAGGPYQSKINDFVTLRGSGVDPYSGGSIRLYEWDFENDGVYDWSVQPDGLSPYPGWADHVYTTEGEHTAVLRVTNDLRNTATDTAYVTITNLPPVAEAYGPYTARLGEGMELYGSGMDLDGAVTLYEWDFDGDGSYDWSNTTTGRAEQITFPVAGTFTAYLRVTDDDGNTATDSTTVSVFDVPSYASATYDRTLAGHTEYVRSVAFNDDGTLLASGGMDSDVRIWNASDGTLVRTFTEHTSAVMAVAFIPGTDLVASAGYDSTVRVWSVTDGSVLHRLTARHSEILSLAVSPDGEWIASGDYAGYVDLWSVNSGGHSAERLAHPGGGAKGVAFSGDGGHVISCGADGYVRMWARLDLIHQLEFVAHEGGANAVASVPGELQIITGGATSTALLWELPSQALLTSFTGHTDEVTSVAVPPHGAYAVSGGRDQYVRIWDVETGAEVRQLWKYPETIESVAISPDGRTIAAAGYGHVVLWKTAY